MTDEIKYVIPLGPFGKVAHSLFVRATLKKIFDFRRKKLEEIFG